MTLPYAKRDSRRLRNAALLVLAISFAGAAVLALLREGGFSEPLSGAIFYRLYVLYEMPAIVLTAVFAFFVYELSTRESTIATIRSIHGPASSLGVNALVAVAVTFATALGAKLLHLENGLAMDEFNADFQSLIFLSGRASAEVPIEWRSAIPSIQPIFVTWLPSDQAWLSAYLPVYAGIRAIVRSVTSVAWITNPLIAGASVISMYMLSIRLNHNKRETQFLIAAMVLSSQFIVMSMTGYAMPAHLLSSLLWLNFYLRRSLMGAIGCSVVGALALGLHNPFPHTLFVAPFLLRMARERRFSELSIVGVSYLIAVATWLEWLKNVRIVENLGGAVSYFSIPTMAELLTQIANLVIVVNWQAPMIGILFVFAVFRWVSLNKFEHDLVAGIVLTLAFYFVFPSSQGHGWGYRYIYACLPSLFLVAGAGLRNFSGDRFPRKIDRLVFVSFVAAAVAQIPWRLRETATIAAPFAKASAAISSSKARVILIPADSVWYGRDLIRNDPWLSNGRVVVNSNRISPVERSLLRARYGEEAQEWSTSHLLEFGLERVSTRER